IGADLRSDSAVAAAVAEVERTLGPIAVLINNAAATKRQRYLESKPEDWQAQIDVTVTGTLRITQAVARGMSARKAGAIVSLMGDSGRVGESGLLVTATAPAPTVGPTRSPARHPPRDPL